MSKTNQDTQVFKGVKKIIEGYGDDIFKELNEGVDGLMLNNVNLGEITALIQEYNVKQFDDNEYHIRDIIKYTIENSSSINSFLLIDIGALIRRYKLWKQYMPNVEPFYAVKCNPNKVILRVLAGLGVGFDVASKEEIAMVKDTTDSEDMIIFANPVKDETHISYAQLENIDMMTFDTEGELRKISINHSKSQLILRIQVDDSKSLQPFNSKFGCPEQNLEEILSLAKILKLNIVGVSFHVGSGCKEASAYGDAIIKAREVFELSKKHGFNLYLLDIGGGFPGYETKEANNKFMDIAAVVNKTLLEYFSDIENLRVIAEPGRFFATSCGTMVTRIIGKKMFVDNTGTKIHYTVNSNIYGLFNNVIFDDVVINFELLRTSKKENEVLYESTIYGNTCDSRDKIGEKLMTEQDHGNWLYIQNHGAYTIASASTFNGFGLGEIKYVLTM